MSSENNDFDLKIVDMPEELVSDLKEVITEAFSNGTDEREIAQIIKKHFDQTHGEIWHCIVGKSFGASGTHETKHFIYLYYKGTAIQLWKCGFPPLRLPEKPAESKDD